jgi:hypothetical protein
MNILTISSENVRICGLSLKLNRIRGRAVSIATRLRDRQPRICCSIPDMGKIFLVSKMSSLTLGPNQPLIQRAKVDPSRELSGRGVTSTTSVAELFMLLLSSQAQIHIYLHLPLLCGR